jgi:hypothetical protein
MAAETTRLIVRPDDAQRITARRSTDVRTALTRGLAEYLESLSIEWAGGRLLKFKSVYEVWAQPEDMSAYPSAMVSTPTDLNYLADPDAPLNPSPPSLQRFEDGRRWSIVGEAEADVTAELWATDPKELTGLIAMMEDGLMPVDWMSGARLELPHYHGVRARFLMSNVTYDDQETNVARRYRKAQVTCHASVPRVRVYPALPNAQPRSVVELL